MKSPFSKDSSGTGCRRRNIGFRTRNGISYLRGRHHALGFIKYDADHSAEFDHDAHDNAVSAFEWCGDWVKVLVVTQDGTCG